MELRPGLFPLQAVYWELDHAMQLNPLPHALVLADSCPAADFTERKSGCVCINPVSHRPHDSTICCDHHGKQSRVNKHGAI